MYLCKSKPSGSLLSPGSGFCDHDRIAPRSHLLVFSRVSRPNQCNVQITGPHHKSVHRKYLSLSDSILPSSICSSCWQVRRSPPAQGEAARSIHRAISSFRSNSFAFASAASSPAADSFPPFPFRFCAHPLQPGFLPPSARGSAPVLTIGLP